jgi:bifunctional non-homologous end joining protein LigD
VPLSWEELGTVSGSSHFTVTNAAARLGELTSDPWADFRKAAVPLKAR